MALRHAKCAPVLALGENPQPALGTKTPASIARSFVCGTHKSRASEGALIKDPLSAPKKRAPFSPYQEKRNTAEIVETPASGAKRRTRAVREPPALSDPGSG